MGTRTQIEGVQVADPPTVEPFVPIKAIAEYLGGVDVRWCVRRSKDRDDPLPVYRVPGAKGARGEWFGKISEVDAWMRRHRAADGTLIDPDA